MGLFLNTTKFHFSCFMCSAKCPLHRVIQDFVQKALFSEIKAVRGGLGNYVC